MKPIRITAAPLSSRAPRRGRRVGPGACAAIPNNFFDFLPETALSQIVSFLEFKLAPQMPVGRAIGLW
jgi:hypothetical protein